MAWNSCGDYCWCTMDVYVQYAYECAVYLRYGSSDVSGSMTRDA